MCAIKPGNDTWFFDKGKAAIDAIGDLDIRKLDALRYIMSQDFVSATAVLRTLDKKDTSGSPIQLEDNAICVLATDSGVFGIVTANRTYYGKEKIQPFSTAQRAPFTYTRIFPLQVNISPVQ